MLRIESLEVRALLSVGDIYGPIMWTEPENATEPVAAADFVLRAQAQTLMAPINLDELSDAKTEQFLEEIETNVSYEEDEDFNVLEPAFILDGKAYYSLSEALAMPRRVVFAAQNATEGSEDDLSDDLLLSSEEANSTRSGGGSETWPLELTCDSTYVDSSLSLVAANALIESRGFDVFQSVPLYNSTYLPITAPAIPTGYVATVSFSGSATFGTDYDVYFCYNNIWSYYQPGNITYSGGSTTFYVAPKNDSVYESVESVTATLQDVSIPGSGGGETVNFQWVTASITASIFDDDQWEATVVTTDDTALEPCSGSLSDADVSAAFIASRVPTSNATLWSNLSSLYSLDLSYPFTVELDFAEPVGNDDTTAGPLDYELRQTLTGSSCGTTISIPANQTQQTVYVRALADNLFEKDEVVSVTVDSAWTGNSGNTFNHSNAPAEMTILQAPEFVSGNDSNPPIYVNADSFVKYIVPDMPNSALLGGQNISASVNGNRPLRYAFYDESHGCSTVSFETDPLLSINAETGVITSLRSLTTEELETPIYYTIVAYVGNNQNFRDMASLTVYPLVVDLDIDSDNYTNGSPSFGSYVFPERTQREETYEVNQYGFGKVLVPNWNDADNDGILDCWDGYSFNNYNQQGFGKSELFYPIVLELPQGIALDEPCIKFIYTMAPTSTPITTNQPPELCIGSIRIWKKNGFESRNGDCVINGGDFVMTSPESVLYTPRQLGFTLSSTTTVLYVEAVSENYVSYCNESDWINIYQNVKPTTSIRVAFNIDGVAIEDEVRYIVSHSNPQKSLTSSFWFNVLNNEELRLAFVSNAIYHRSTLQDFGMQLLQFEELASMQINQSIRSLLLSEISGDFWTTLVGQPSAGFNAGIYYDHISGKAVLAFAGSDDTGDFLADILQGLGFPTGQYECANMIGVELLNLYGSGQNYVSLANSTPSQPTGFTITGHSLGGGLARTAMYVTGFTTKTFNSAGLASSTISSATSLRVSNGYPAIDVSNSSSLIEEYVTEHDILYASGFGANAGMASLTTLQDEYLIVGLEAHKIRQILYGLMYLYNIGQ